MVTYKLFKIKNGKLFPLYIESKREMVVGEWLKAGVGELVDDSHVKASGLGGKAALRPGFHSTFIPFTDWIGKKGADGKLYQRPDTVWCRCQVRGTEKHVADKKGSKTLVPGYYFFRTNSRQKEPWIISDEILIEKILTHDEVREICNREGYIAQEVAA